MSEPHDYDYRVVCPDGTPSDAAIYVSYQLADGQREMMDALHDEAICGFTHRVECSPVRDWREAIDSVRRRMGAEDE